MDIKKSDLYSSLRDSCDELSWGMDAVLMGMDAKLPPLEQRQNKIRSLKQGKSD